ncbi:MAG: cation-translocating P-type ATPase [Pseudomonadota bacterium]
MSATTLAISDMHCSACVGKVERLLRSHSWIEAFMVNPFSRRVYLTHDDRHDPLLLLKELEDLGFQPTLIEQRTEADESYRSRELKRIGVAGVCAMQVMMASVAVYFGDAWGMDDGIRQLLAWASLLLCVPLVGYCAQPFFAGALRALRRGVSMDVPIALAIVVAFAVSVQHTVAGAGALYFDSVGMFVFLLLLARFYDARLRRVLSAEDRLQQLLPQTVYRMTAAGPEEADAAAVQIGDTLWVPEGAIVPADGELKADGALLDESVLSGEADWVRKSRGAPVYAGTHNRGAGFEMQALAVPRDSRAAEIQTLSARISLTKAPLARLADRLARIFVPTILGLAAVTYLLHRFAVGGLPTEDALSAALAVLIVSCPCALALAIPAATAAALIRARRLGILLADSGLLETLPTIRQVLLDKTGTVLAPDLALTRVVTWAGWSADSVYALASALQRHSSHPIAAAFRAPALPRSVAVSPQQSWDPVADWTLGQIEAVAGAGLSAVLKFDGWVADVRLGSAQHCGIDPGQQADSAQTVFLCLDGDLLAAFELRSELRPDAALAVDRLRSGGRSLMILSGDSRAACQRVGSELGIKALDSLSPEQKRELLLDLRQAEGPVMFVGDGINDALAFAEADVSVATLETSDYVQANADAVLLSSRLETLPDLFALGAAVQRVIRQNLGWAFGYNVILIPLAMLGYVSPWLAAVGMASSSLLVMANASRLLRFDPAPTAAGATGATDLEVC